MKDYIKLDKNKRHIGVSKNRFDNAIQELNPTSAVYLENYNTVSKIGNMVTDSILTTIHLREDMIHKLQNIVEQQKKFLEEDRTILTEVEFSLLSKNPEKINQASADDDLLPTYEKEEDDDDDDDIDSSCDDSDSIGSNSKLKSLKRRSMDSMSPGLEEEESKKRRSDISDQDKNNEDATKTEETEGTITDNVGHQNTYQVEENAGITSNIQDLLSKLAN